MICFLCPLPFPFLSFVPFSQSCPLPSLTLFLPFPSVSLLLSSPPLSFSCVLQGGLKLTELLTFLRSVIYNSELMNAMTRLLGTGFIQKDLKNCVSMLLFPVNVKVSILNNSQLHFHTLISFHGLSLYS